MLQKYDFSGDGVIEFEDSKTVRQLLEYAFEQFGYYEPIGMEYVTLFQSYSPKTSTGWFTTDVSASCAQEIQSFDHLCFAYHMPGVFYYAEGGWGHHMQELGNHPQIPNPVSLHLAFDDFDHTVVINGNYTLRDVVDYLMGTGYLETNIDHIKIRVIRQYASSYVIELTDPLMDVDLNTFEKQLPSAVTIICLE